MESRHRQRQLVTCNMQHATAQRASLKGSKQINAGLVLGPNRSTDPVQDSPPRQSRRPGVQALACLSQLSRRVCINPRPKVLQGQTSLKRPACPAAAVLARPALHKPHCVLGRCYKNARAARPCWFCTRPVSETSIYRTNRDQRVFRVSFSFSFFLAREHEDPACSWVAGMQS